jgi:hypothetical protein
MHMATAVASEGCRDASAQVPAHTMKQVLVAKTPMDQSVQNVDPVVLMMPADYLELPATYRTLDDVRARLQVLAARKKQREGLVTSEGRRLVETLMNSDWKWVE